ncbi:MAG: glucose-6-phosphate isomerase [Deltaproteobacteria bacterium]|nr:glucose-6-phosphate isomerase [Deltaproteobacteria bacterium]
MEAVKLDGFGVNETIRHQVARGRGERSSYASPSFEEANTLSLDVTYMFDSPEGTSIHRKDVEEIAPRAVEANRMLERGEGDICDRGIPMTGWLNLPEEIAEDHLKDITSITRALAHEIDAFVSLGIGGSYLGVEATVRALTHTCFNQLTREQRGNAPEIYFLGQNMDPDYYRDTLDLLDGKRVGLNVISKSGTTTETAIAFRILQPLLERSLGTEAKKFILVTTDKEKGALRKLAGKKGYRTFVVPDNIGGRFSVLSDVGLVGLAMANVDIGEFTAGFRRMRRITRGEDFWKNPALVHAALRYAAWLKGKKIEVVATNACSLYSVARWMEQLFPESEGHSGQGLWVSPSLYSEKLHANGQMVQQGERNIIETFLLLLEHDNRVEIPKDPEDADGLNFLPEKGRDMNFVNRRVVEGPAYAHYQGGVPNMTVEIPRRNAYNLGQLYYMMERSVAVSGYLLGHNPFVQPGVESYKNAMFALIGKPGFEDKATKIEERLKKLERIRVHAA